jgi:hypothetical protein
MYGKYSWLGRVMNEKGPLDVSFFAKLLSFLELVLAPFDHVLQWIYTDKKIELITLRVKGYGFHQLKSSRNEGIKKHAMFSSPYKQWCTFWIENVWACWLDDTDIVLAFKQNLNKKTKKQLYLTIDVRETRGYKKKLI